MIVPKKKWVFIHITKCAGTAVGKALNKQYQCFEDQIEWNWNHDKPALFEYDYFRREPGQAPLIVYNKHATYDMVKGFFPDWQYFTQMRHPTSRWGSIYSFLSYRGMIDSPFEEWTPRAIEAVGKQVMEEFIDASEKYNFWQNNFPTGLNLRPMMYTQRYFLPRKDPKKNITIFRLEDKSIWKALKIPEIKQLSSPDKFKQKIKWTPTLKNLVKDFYYEDMEVGNYA